MNPLLIYKTKTLDFVISKLVWEEGKKKKKLVSEVKKKLFFSISLRIGSIFLSDSV